jgi:hypothetical protein
MEGVAVPQALAGDAAVGRLSATVTTNAGGASPVATYQALTLFEDNDETITLTILPGTSGSLAGVTGLEFVLKPTDCVSDSSEDALVLTTEPDGGIVIDSQSADEITATVTLPAAALADPYDRVWRVDALTGASRRTAIYGPVTVVDL